MLVLRRGFNEAIVLYSESDTFPTILVTVMSVGENCASVMVERLPRDGAKPRPEYLELHGKLVLGKCTDQAQSEVSLMLVRCDGNRVRLAIAAPTSVTIYRKEVLSRVAKKLRM